MSGVSFSPVRIAIVLALLIAAVVAFVLRPAQLFVNPGARPTLLHTPDPARAPALPPRSRPRPLVYVAGAVVHPGVYDVADDARARDALARAGGATSDADLVAVNLAAHVTDGEEIAVPRIGDPPPASHAARGHLPRAGGLHRRHRPVRGPAHDDGQPGEPAALIDVNAADEKSLAELPGIGPTLAARIVEFRAINGPFVTLDGLADVAGITSARLDALATLVKVGH